MRPTAVLDSPAIVRDIALLGRRLPRELPLHVRKVLFDTLSRVSQESYRRYGNRLATAFATYLAVTDTSLSRHLADKRNATAWRGLIGALNSARFIDAPSGTRYLYTRVAIEVAKILWPLDPTFDKIVPSAVEASSSIKPLAAKFDAAELDSVQVALWRGWPVQDARGRIHWPPLHSVAIRHGMAFANKLHTAIENYWSGSKRDKIAALPLFIEALTSFNGVTPESLLNRVSVRSFWEKFWTFYKCKRSETCNQSTVVNDWTREWKEFVSRALEGPGLFARCAGAFPGPDEKNNADNSRSLQSLLCAFPTEQLTDEEALKFLKVALPQTLDHVKTWATHKTRDILARRRARKRAALNGEVRKIGTTSQSLVSRENPSHYANACATFKRHGYLTRQDVKSLQVLYPSHLGMVADDLGLPTAGALLPHAALLVAEHSELTPSMLENLNLWNKNGKLTGLSKQASGIYYLRAPKYRGKSRTGYKSILLNHRSLRIIKEILILTREIRQYLKDRGNADWRKLFITCGQAFSEPKSVKRFATFTSAADYTEILTKEFTQILRMQPEAARDFVRRLSLRSVRLTKALCVYVETHSEAEMAKALGHAALRGDVLKRYLPPDLRKFFRERWIRIFHSYQVISVLKGSKYLLPATNFRNIAEVDAFMLKHAFPTVSTFSKGALGPDSQPSLQSARVVFNASPDVLRVMASLNLLTKQQPSATSVLLEYWREVSHAVLAYLKERIGLNPSIDAALRVAEETADTQLVAHML